MWNYVTFLGDSNFTLPCATLLLLWLCYNKQWRAAICWGLCFGTAMFLVAASKVAFMAWYIVPPLLGNFTGVSGHTASATSLYLALAVALMHNTRSRLRWLVIATSATLVTAVAISRLELRVHSVSEVICGVLTGGIAAAVFAAGLHAAQNIRRPLSGKLALSILMLALLFITNGRPAPTQDVLTQIARSLSDRNQVYGRTTPL